jgi:predicted enzyme related to lactoylglutathione lyase
MAVPPTTYTAVPNPAPLGLNGFGSCHAKGPNTGLPLCLLLHITVDTLDDALAKVTYLGGTIIRQIHDMDPMGCIAVITDPCDRPAALDQRL